MLPYQPKDLPMLEITVRLEPQGHHYNLLQRANFILETCAWRGGGGERKKEEVLLFMESVCKLKVNQTNPNKSSCASLSCSGTWKPCLSFWACQTSTFLWPLNSRCAIAEIKTNTRIIPLILYQQSFHDTYLIRESVTSLLCITAKLPANEGRSYGSRVTISARYLQTVLFPQLSLSGTVKWKVPHKAGCWKQNWCLSMQLLKYTKQFKDLLFIF